MKSIISILIFCLLSFSCALTAQVVDHKEVKTINFCNWANTLPEHVLKKFTKETGIKVNYSSFSSNEALYAKLKANPAIEYDLVVPSTYFVQRMMREGMLQKIDLKKITHFNQIDPFFLSQSFDQKNEYSIPFFWSTTGIVYNTKYYPKNSINTWEDLWSEKYKNTLAMLDDNRELFSVALMVLGFSANSQHLAEIKLAYEKLQGLMPNIRLFNSSAVAPIFMDEDIHIGMIWNGDFIRAKKVNPYLEYVLPEDGFVISLDNLAIPKGAQHVENAHLLIDFLLRPEIAKEIFEYMGYRVANLGAIDLLPESIRNDPVMFPSADMLKNGQLQTDIGDKVEVYEEYFEQLKLEN